MKVTAVTKTDNSAFGESIKICPLMIPALKVPRVSPEGEKFTIEFSDKQIKKAFNEYMSTLECEQTYNHFILENESELLGVKFPVGTWVYCELVNDGYTIEGIMKNK